MFWRNKRFYIIKFTSQSWAPAVFLVTFLASQADHFYTNEGREICFVTSNKKTQCSYSQHKTPPAILHSGNRTLKNIHHWKSVAWRKPQGHHLCNIVGFHYVLLHGCIVNLDDSLHETTIFCQYKRDLIFLMC